jgi:hypothetical protein
MAPIEWQPVDPEEMIREIETFVQRSRENKYVYQVGLKDVDFDIDENRLEILGLTLPFRSIDQAEDAMRNGVIHPGKLIEQDGTLHQILAFDHRPVGYSGFMDCVTHSLALTDKGLFEVGRFPGVSLTEPVKQWQWFIHRRLATPEDLHDWQESDQLTAEELLKRVYSVMTGIGDE